MGMHQMLGPSFGASEDYVINRSLRFNSTDDTYLFFNPSGHGNRKVFTFSFWVKRATLGTSQLVLYVRSGAGNTGRVRFDASDRFEVESEISGSAVAKKVTTAKFRDCSAWQHFVVKFDAVNTNCDIYHNGVELTAFDTNTEPTNVDHYFGGDYSHYLGGFADSESVDGYLAEVHMVNGQALAASDFGEFNDDNVWQPKKYSGTYGTNGFYLDFSDNSSNAALGTDSSGNSNNWTVNNLSAAYNFGLTKAAQIVGTSKTFSFPITYTATLTYEFFVKITTDGTYNYMAKMTGDQWNLGTSGSSLLFGNYNGGWTTFSNTGLNDAAWHFVRLTTTGSSTSLYVDGSLIATNSSGGSVSTGSQVTNQIRGTGSGAFEIAHLRITTGGTPPTTGVPNISDMNAAAGSGGTLVFYDKLDYIASSGTKTSDGGNVTITMSAATVGVTDPNADSLIDTPTNGDSSDDTGAGGEISGNYCVINPLGVSSNTPTISEGNLKMVLGASQGTRHGTMGVTSGKWYFEVVYTAASPLDGMVGVANKNHENNLGNYTGGDADGWGYYYNGEKYNNGGQGSYGASWGVNDVMGIALDMDNGALYFSKNGTYQNSGDPTSGSSKTGAAFTNLSGTIFPCINGYGGTQVVNFGQRRFNTSAPSGYKCWNTANLPTPTIADGSTLFDVITATGNGAERTFTMPGGFGPDLVWSKSRSNSYNHGLFDAVRGGTKRLRSNSTAAEDTSAQQVKSFTSDGFVQGTDVPNTSGETGVYWAWDAGTSTASNTDGSQTSQVRANQTAGFSIATFNTPSPSANFTYGHGLNAVPEFVIHKFTSSNSNWYIYHKSIGQKYINLNDTDGSATSQFTTAPTSSVFTYPSNLIVGPNYPLVAYSFTSVAGYSSFGSYTGNGNANGPFVFTGMRPAWLLLKESSSNGELWTLYDSTRNPFNVAGKQLYPSLNAAEADASASTHARVDFLSNGFKIRGSHSSINTNGETIIYAAFAEHPFKTARAR